MASCSRPGGTLARWRTHQRAHAGSANGARKHAESFFTPSLAPLRTPRDVQPSFALEDRWPVRPSTLCPTARGRSPVVIRLSSRRHEPAGGTEPHHPTSIPIYQYQTLSHARKHWRIRST